MKKVTYCLIVLFITLMVSAATLEAATVITSLPYTITAQGSYIINQNLKASWHGIKVQANNVTIDLNGYSISGNNTSGGYGIYMNGRSNVEIRNGTIRNFGSHGIYEESSSGNSHRVVNVRVMNNKGNGILLLGSNHMVKDCTTSNNGGSGIYTHVGCMISGNTVYDNGYEGISANSGSTVSGNTAYNNGRTGIYANSGSTIIGNTAYSNGGHGIYCNGGGVCTVKNNTVSYNQWNGISLNGNSLVDGNTAYENNQSGGLYYNIIPCETCVFGLNFQGLI
jgi:parallel beta-helix repeat protein